MCVLAGGVRADVTDTKYFCSYLYEQPGIFNSVFSLSPEIRFDKGVSRLNYFGLRTGNYYNLFPWLDVGIYYRYIDQIDINNDWSTNNRIEFVFTPKIVLSFLHQEELQKIAESAKTSGEALMKEMKSDDIVTASGKRALRFMVIDLHSQIEYWDVDLRDVKKLNPVLRIKPGTSWLYDYGTVYVADEALHSFKYGDWFSNWIRFGVIRPFYGMRLDMYYMYESEKPDPLLPDWEHANIFGTSFSYTVK